MSAKDAPAPAPAPTSARGSAGLRVLLRAVEILALPVVIILIWWFATEGSTNYLNPPLSKIVSVFGTTWFSKDQSGHSLMLNDVVPGVIRLLVGYLLSLVVGIALGVAIGSFARLRAFCEPVLEFLRAIPPPILVPILMMFLGIGDELRIGAIAFGSVWPILLNTIDGVRGIDPVLQDTVASYRFGLRARLFKVVLPAASPRIVTGARQALPLAIILMVISEMFAASDGLGYAILTFSKSFAIPQMWGGVILLGVIGVLCAFLFKIITDRILAWYHGYLQAQRGA